MEQQPLELRETSAFKKWMRKIKNIEGRTLIALRIRRLQAGHFGDMRGVGDGVFELRIHHGPGYRVYGTKIGCVVVILLCGGDKTTQHSDIAQAKRLARELRKKGESHA